MKNYSDILSQEQIIGLCKLNYTGWARFSRKFLTEIYHTDAYTGECKNIITMLYETNENLMELFSYKYTFLKEIENYNNKNSNNDVFDKSILDDLYVSPAIKRSIWRVMMLSKEIVKITGLQPKKIFIEMARDVNDGSKKGKRTQSRKNQLLEYYQKAKIEEKELLSQLENADEGDLRDNRIYLYYAQMGRCMYSGEKIDFSQINSFYDIDHIYPQSKVKDDSITANKVLVKKTLNSSKGDMYPIPEKCLSKEAYNLWKVLLDKGLITKEKYSRLIRKNEFSDDELSGFIARQLVETRQSTKAVAEILKKSYPESKMVYVKAGNVSLFREDYGIKKSRIVNDYHHAKDAYLNIVVGNVYDEKFTSNPINFINKKNTYSMNRVFEFPVIKGDKVVWESKDAQSLIKVKNQVEKNDILFTRYATTNNSVFFNQMPVKAQKIINSKGSLFLPLKQNDDRLADMTKYGGYDSIKGAYFFLVEHIQKGKKVRTIEFVPVYLAKKIEQSIDELQKYIDENLKLVDAKILLPKIKINTLFKINGAYMHLSGRTGLQLTFKGAMPLVISKYLYEYTKKIESYINRNKEQKTILPIGPLQKITAEDNLKLYDELLHKLKDTIYNIRLSSQIKTFENGREKFISLNLQQQCQLLYNAMILFGTTPALADLTLIGGSKNAGVLVASSNISNSNQISIINQSVTGIFKEEIDLKSDELANCRNK
ncbi:MAG: type II CRISPR RNA-guided endonuclease Cas9 [Oscillospiraceae bacterium]